MKTFNQFKHDMNEGVAALAIPVGAGILKKIAASSALKAIGSGALTGGALTGVYLASKKTNKDKGEEEIERLKRAEEEEVGQAITGGTTGQKLPPVRKRDIIKGGFKKYKEGLKVAQNPTVAKKYNPNVDIVKQELEKRKGKNALRLLNKFKERFKENMKSKRDANDKIDKDLGKK